MSSKNNIEYVGGDKITQNGKNNSVVTNSGKSTETKWYDLWWVKIIIGILTGISVAFITFKLNLKR